MHLCYHEKDMISAIIYIRVNTDEQAQKKGTLCMPKRKIKQKLTVRHN